MSEKLDNIKLAVAAMLPEMAAEQAAVEAASGKFAPALSVLTEAQPFAAQVAEYVGPQGKGWEVSVVEADENGVKQVMTHSYGPETYRHQPEWAKVVDLGGEATAEAPKE